MRCDTGFVVSGAATVKAPVTLGGLERRGVPLGWIAFGLHVMVGVQQNRRRTRGWRIVRDHRGRTAFSDDPDLGKARFRQQLCHGLGAAVHFVAPRRVGPHRLDADQILQIGPDRRQHLLDPLHDISHGDDISRTVEPARAPR